MLWNCSNVGQEQLSYLNIVQSNNLFRCNSRYYLSMDNIFHIKPQYRLFLRVLQSDNLKILIWSLLETLSPKIMYCCWNLHENRQPIRTSLLKYVGASPYKAEIFEELDHECKDGVYAIQQDSNNSFQFTVYHTQGTKICGQVYTWKVI